MIRRNLLHLGLAGTVTSMVLPPTALAAPGATPSRVGPLPVTCPSGAIIVNNGSNIQTAMNAAGPGASLCIKQGTYRPSAPLKPLSGQVLTFESGAIVSGAQVVSNWTKQGSNWMLGGQTQDFSSAPWLDYLCTDNPAACVYEDLFMDDKPMQHVLSLSNLGPGKTYFDKGADRMYIADNPVGHKMEVTRLTMGVDSSVSNVTIRGGTFEKFAWKGLKVTGNGWTIEDGEFRYVHALGLSLSGANHIVRRNYVHDNGALGIGLMDGSGVVFDSNEVAFNNYLRFGHRPIPHNEGGAKIMRSPNTTVRGNNVHDNDGNGWWFDTGNKGSLVESNTFANNSCFGFYYEVSFDAVVRNNIFRANSVGTTGWLGGGMRVANSTNVEAYGNTFDLNGYGPFLATWVDREVGTQTTGLYFHDNTVNMVGGLVGSKEGKVQIGSPSSNNRFQHNTYRVSDLTRQWWIWPLNGKFQRMNWTTWRSLGFDTTGTIALR